ncbi:MAG: AraC family transcriptional regulator [Eubacteriales bacterium]|nr:AraC family transcriptional regulator [Eubacteriales bacterium]
MTVDELIQKTGWTLVAGNAESDITSAYVCDLLSWVMAHGQEGTAWVTVQTHLNVIAVASLHRFSCVVIPENIAVSKETIAAANEKGVCMLSAACSSYGAAMAMASFGIGEVGA